MQAMRADKSGVRTAASWWWAARLASLLVTMAALAYAFGHYGVGATGNTAGPAAVQEPDNSGYGVGAATARGSR